MQIDNPTSLNWADELEIYAWTKDKKLRFTSCSENMAMVAGMDSPHSLTNKTDFDMEWRNRAQTYLEGEKVALSGTQYKNFELLKTTKGTIEIIVTKCPLFNRYNQIIGTIGSSINVTGKHLVKKEGKLGPDGVLYLGSNFNNEYLTRREVDVMRYILCGYTSKEIGLVLNISYRTIEGHVDSIKQKLQCKSKGDIIATAVRFGLTYLCDFK